MKKLIAIIIIIICLLDTIPAMAVTNDDPRLFSIYMPLVIGKSRSEP